MTSPSTPSPTPNPRSESQAPGPRLLVGGVAIRGLWLRAVGDLRRVGDADPQRGGRRALDGVDVARLRRRPSVLQRGGHRARHLRPVVPPQRDARRRRVHGGRVRRRRAKVQHQRDPQRVLLLQVWGVHAAP
uniref:Uncharacterized protein n=1 Tax=Triticum urartu TaxID=4572 RepID=A0A8R7TT43_TRIUA